MPFINVHVPEKVTKEQGERLLREVSGVVAEVTGKPEAYMMVAVHQGQMAMAGKPADAAFVDVRCLGGLNDSVNEKLSRRLCDTLKAVAGIEPDSVYLNFTDIMAQNWGWKGTTFSH
jgi:4-oxalocrotonate tautomerase family enzyme